MRTAISHSCHDSAASIINAVETVGIRRPRRCSLKGMASFGKPSPWHSCRVLLGAFRRLYYAERLRERGMADVACQDLGWRTKRLPCLDGPRYWPLPLEV